MHADGHLLAPALFVILNPNFPPCRRVTEEAPKIPLFFVAAGHLLTQDTSSLILGKIKTTKRESGCDGCSRANKKMNPPKNARGWAGGATRPTAR